MSLFKSVPAVMILITVLSCSRGFTFEEMRMGSGLGGKGHITEDTLRYSFKYRGGDSFKDLCNFIYFEGDTVCFSADFSENIDGIVRAEFVDPTSGVTYRAERVEKIRSRIYGFSLVGSLLESFNRSRLDESLPKSRVIKLPFVVRIEGESAGKKAAGEAKGECEIRF
ncbi:MAG TPA: hypothetical protein PKK43_03810 [Spirochaetota bacterium]|nr:hypothetical protein [Spirochaetota bacterium]